MGLSSCQKGGSVIGFVLQPHGVNDPDPEVGQGPHRHAMAFPFGPLALVERPSPGLLPGGLPGELVKGIASGLHTSIPLVGLAVAATLVGHGRGPAKAWMLPAPVYRSRSSPHSARSRDARRFPAPGRLQNRGLSGCWTKKRWISWS
jgi:hypothetical protein